MILKNLLKVSVFFYSTLLFSQNILGIKEMNKIEIKTINDTISFIHSNLNEKSKPTIIFIQGSLPISIVLKEKELIWANLPFDYKKYISKINFVLINRKGVPLISEYNDYERIQNNPSKEYLENDNLYYRVFQVEEVLKYLKKQKWVDNNKYQ